MRDGLACGVSSRSRIACAWMMKLRPEKRAAATTEPSPTCPECGAEVIYDLTCHTYGQGDRWYACMPCDSAVRYICVRELDDEGECGWEYTHGLNPRNPRAAANEQHRPAWIPEGQACGEWRVPGVRLIGT